MDQLGNYQKDTRDIHTFLKVGTGAMARTEIGIVIGE